MIDWHEEAKMAEDRLNLERGKSKAIARYLRRTSIRFNKFEDPVLADEPYNCIQYRQRFVCCIHSS